MTHTIDKLEESYENDTNYLKEILKEINPESSCHKQIRFSNYSNRKELLSGIIKFLEETPIDNLNIDFISDIIDYFDQYLFNPLNSKTIRAQSDFLQLIYKVFNKKYEDEVILNSLYWRYVTNVLLHLIQIDMGLDLVNLLEKSMVFFTDPEDKNYHLNYLKYNIFKLEYLLNQNKLNDDKVFYTIKSIGSLISKIKDLDEEESNFYKLYFKYLILLLKTVQNDSDLSFKEKEEDIQNIIKVFLKNYKLLNYDLTPSDQYLFEIFFNQLKEIDDKLSLNNSKRNFNYLWNLLIDFIDIFGVKNYFGRDLTFFIGIELIQLLANTNNIDQISLKKNKEILEGIIKFITSYFDSNIYIFKNIYEYSFLADLYFLLAQNEELLEDYINAYQHFNEAFLIYQYLKDQNELSEDKEIKYKYISDHIHKILEKDKSLKDEVSFLDINNLEFLTQEKLMVLANQYFFKANIRNTDNALYLFGKAEEIYKYLYKNVDKNLLFNLYKMYMDIAEERFIYEDYDLAIIYSLRGLEYLEFIYHNVNDFNIKDLKRFLSDTYKFLSKNHYFSNSKSNEVHLDYLNKALELDKNIYDEDKTSENLMYLIENFLFKILFVRVNEENYESTLFHYLKTYELINELLKKELTLTNLLLKIQMENLIANLLIKYGRKEDSIPYLNNFIKTYETLKENFSRKELKETGTEYEINRYPIYHYTGYGFEEAEKQLIKIYENLGDFKLKSTQKEAIDYYLKSLNLIDFIKENHSYSGGSTPWLLFRKIIQTSLKNKDYSLVNYAIDRTISSYEKALLNNEPLIQQFVEVAYEAILLKLDFYLKENNYDKINNLIKTALSITKLGFHKNNKYSFYPEYLLKFDLILIESFLKQNKTKEVENYINQFRFDYESILNLETKKVDVKPYKKELKTLLTKYDYKI